MKTTAGITIRGTLGGQTDDPPVIASTPAPVFIEGTADTYDMTQHVNDDAVSTVTYSLSNTLPNGLSFNTSTGILSYDGIAGASLSSHQLTATDAVGSDQSVAFNIQVQALPSTSELQFPLLGCSRIGSKNYAAASATADREALSWMDIVLLGGFQGQQMDQSPPPSGWLSRGAVSLDIYNRAVLNGNPNIKIGTYYNFMETSKLGGSTWSDKCVAEQWFLLDGTGQVVGTPFASGYIDLRPMNEDADGKIPAVWYAENRVPPFHDPQIAAGVPEENLMIYADNCNIKARTSGVDWSVPLDGTEDDAQEFFDTEDPAHVSACSVCVNQFALWQQGFADGYGALDTLYPASPKAVNTNEWDQNSTNAEALANLVKVPLGYQDPLDEFTSVFDSGFSENNSKSRTEGGFPRSGMGSNGVQRTSGSWLDSHANVTRSINGLRGEKYCFFSWRIQCTENVGSTGTTPNQALYATTAQPGAYHDFFWWCFVGALMSNSYFTVSGVVIDDPDDIGRGRSTVLFDVFGTQNTETTKLHRRWIGTAVDGPQTAPFYTDPVSGEEFYGREFENAFALHRVSNDDTQGTFVFDTSLLPGGADEWMELVLTDDNRFQGATLGSTVTFPAGVSSRLYARRSWLEPRLAA